MNSGVISFIKGEFSKTQEFEELGKGFFKLVWAPGLFQAGTGEDRTQTIWLFVRENTLTVASPFTEVGVISAEDAIAYGSQTLLGVQTGFDHYCLVHVLDVKHVVDELYFWIEAVASAADDLDSAIHGDDSF